MKKFEIYWEELYRQLKNIRYEQEQQHRAAPVNRHFIQEDTGEKEKELHHKAMVEYMRAKGEGGS